MSASFGPIPLGGICRNNVPVEDGIFSVVLDFGQVFQQGDRYLEIAVRQEDVAHLLGVRREGVTEAAGKLQKAGLIRYNRGRISVTDRPAAAAIA